MAAPIENAILDAYLSLPNLRPETLATLIPDYKKFTPLVEGLLYANEEVLNSLKTPFDQALFLIIGPPTSGKSSVTFGLIGLFENQATRIITHTSRKKRSQEPTDAYHFITDNPNAIPNQLIETVPPGSQGETFYGTSVEAAQAALEEMKNVTFWVGEPNGAHKITDWMHQHYPNIPVITIMILPDTNPANLEKRILEHRGTDQANRWRQNKARVELLEEGPRVADVILVNWHHESGEPRESLEIIGTFIAQLINWTA